MRNRPHAPDLLAAARTTLMSALVPALPVDQHRTALMVADAMAIAEREATAAEAPLRAELARLRAIYPTAPISDEPPALQLGRFNRQLAVDLRRGTFERDRASREQVRMHLVQTAMERVRETNPEFLQKEGLE